MEDKNTHMLLKGRFSRVWASAVNRRFVKEGSFGEQEKWWDSEDWVHTWHLMGETIPPPGKRMMEEEVHMHVGDGNMRRAPMLSTASI